MSSTFYGIAFLELLHFLYKKTRKLAKKNSNFYLNELFFRVINKKNSLVFVLNENACADSEKPE
jgi:hypothetical protein